MYLWAMDYLKVCPAQQAINDIDFINILYEYAMNYSLEGFRKAYAERLKKESEKVTRDQLRELGYSEEDLRDIEC